MCARTLTHAQIDTLIFTKSEFTELLDRALNFTKDMRVLNSSSLDIKVKGDSKQHVVYNFIFAYTYNTHLQTQNEFFFAFSKCPLPWY